MQGDPLEQLRDVHMPADPSWWPLALGWWIAALLIAGVVGYSLWLALKRHRAHAPMRQAGHLLARYEAAFAAAEMTPLEYVDRCNELLKRYLVRALGRHEFAELSGEAWLQALDELSASTAFTTGSGRVLGNDRFKREPTLRVDGLGDHIRAALRGAYA